ncbi:MAG: hypothetical protein PHN69_06420 [Candidatus Pacebacteria bacterium]|nr:hypothetical protein [Candidatus Paceibacterota bacterium]
MKLIDTVASLGLAFFIVAHLQFVPIADRMKRHHDKMKEKIEKVRKFDEVNLSTKFRQRRGFPRQKVFAT